MATTYYANLLSLGLQVFGVNNNITPEPIYRVYALGIQVWGSLEPIISDSFTCYCPGTTLTTATSGYNTYTRGISSYSGYYDLYLEGAISSTSGYPLYIYGSAFATTGCPLYITSSQLTTSGFDLFLQPSYGQDASICAFLRSDLPIKTNDLFLTLYNDQTISEFILDLYIEGAGVNSDYYPYSQNIPLFINNGRGIEATNSVWCYCESIDGSTNTYYNAFINGCYMTYSGFAISLPNISALSTLIADMYTTGY